MSINIKYPAKNFFGDIEWILRSYNIRLKTKSFSLNIKLLLNGYLATKTRRHEEKFFCLNSGNCGSHYLIKLLKNNSIDRCYHEKFPDLNLVGVDYYFHKVARNRIKKYLLHTRANVYFEASNRLFAFADELSEVFPKARFIHLHRDGRERI